MTWRIAELAPGDAFPPADQALPALSPFPGLLAASATLDASWLESAYRQGIFPWYAPGEPVLWWCPDPRMVLDPAQLKVRRSLKQSARRWMRAAGSALRMDSAFDAVIAACADTRRHTGTWITDEIRRVYGELHRRGLAHSVELWDGDRLVAGLYAVAIGRMVFGESMFTTVDDGSKICLMALCGFARRTGVPLIDCQQQTRHLARMGAAPMPRTDFLAAVAQGCDAPGVGPWRYDWSQFATDCACWL